MLGMFAFNIVILYHYTLLIIPGIIFTAPGFSMLEYRLVSRDHSFIKSGSF